MTDILPLISRWLHIVPAIILVGGTLFLRFSLVPAWLENDASTELREAVRRRWSRLVMASILFLLASGLYNSALKAIDYQLDGVYHGLLGLKIVLGLVVFYLASVLSGRSEKAKRFRENEVYWLNILCVLMLIIVLAGGYMKLGQYERKPEPDADAQARVVHSPTFSQNQVASIKSP